MIWPQMLWERTRLAAPAATRARAGEKNDNPLEPSCVRRGAERGTRGRVRSPEYCGHPFPSFSKFQTADVLDMGRPARAVERDDDGQPDGHFGRGHGDDEKTKTCA